MAVFLPFEKSLEEVITYELEEVIDNEDPLDVEFMSSSENGDDNASNSEMDVEIMELEESGLSFDEMIERKGHCSRTLVWIRNPVNSSTSSSKEHVVKDFAKENRGNPRKSTFAMMDQSDKSTETPISHSGDHRKCPDCGEKFNGNSKFVNHVQNKECQLLKCFFCDRLLFRRQLKEHLERCDEKPMPYECVICKKLFKRVESLISHQSSHSRNKNGVCFTCGQFFPSKTLLKTHRKNCKSTEALKSKLIFPMFRCGECVSPFSGTNSLRKHWKSRKHSNCVCGDCGKNFKDIISLCSHIRESHDNWCSKCPYCSRKFAERRALREHYVRCSCVCQRCNKLFTSKQSMEEHLQKSHSVSN